MDPIFKQGNAKQEMKNWLKILPHLPVIALFALHHFQLHPLALVSRARLGGLSSIHVWTITTIIHYATALYVNQQFFLKNRISNKKKEPTPLKGLEQKNVDYIPDEEIPFDSSSDLPQKIEAPPISGQQPVTIESSHLQKLSKLDIDSILDAMAPAYGNVEAARKAIIDSKNPEIFYLNVADLRALNVEEGEIQKLIGEESEKIVLAFGALEFLSGKAPDEIAEVIGIPVKEIDVDRDISLTLPMLEALGVTQDDIVKYNNRGEVVL